MTRAHDTRVLVGDHPAIVRLRELIGRVAHTEVTVLLAGEPGTGKELVARLIHAASARASAPFAMVDCAATPPHLLEAELFGDARPGGREGACAVPGSTLFLDEVADAPLDVQAKLLRAIELHRYRRVGSSTEEECALRVIATTTRDLAAEVSAGRFRSDLYFRLRMIPLELPPLRARAADVDSLAEHFLVESASRHRRARAVLSPAARAALRAHDWPGNVRELRSVIEAAAVLCPGEELQPEHFVGLRVPRGPTSSAERAIGWLRGVIDPDAPDELPPLKEARARMERAYLSEVLRRSGGNVAASARLAQRNRSDFYELLRRHGLEPLAFKRLASGLEP